MLIRHDRAHRVGITYRGIVYPWQGDHMGHMNVMWYAGKFDEACRQLLAMVGLHPSRFAQDGTGMAAVEQHIHYKRELLAGDAVTIQSTVLEVKDKSIQMLHKNRRTDTQGNSNPRRGASEGDRNERARNGRL